MAELCLSRALGYAEIWDAHVFKVAELKRSRGCPGLWCGRAAWATYEDKDGAGAHKSTVRRQGAGGLQAQSEVHLHRLGKAQDRMGRGALPAL